MLLDFKVSNFLSFNDEQEINLKSGKVRKHSERLFDIKDDKYLKFAAIYGANASGKSNLVSALDVMKKMVVRKISNEVTDKYFRLIESNKLQNSTFETEISIDGETYNYGFDINLYERKVIKEWLFETGLSKKKLVFSRNVLNSTYRIGDCFSNPSTRERFDIYADDIKSDHSTLFLRVMNENKKDFYKKYSDAKLVQDVYDWFKFSLDVNFPDSPISTYSYFLSEDNIEEVNDVMESFGLGITKFNVIEESIDSMKFELPKQLIKEIKSRFDEMQESNPDGYGNGMIVRNIRNDFMMLSMNENNEIISRTVKFNHGTDALFEMSEESEGTARLIDLLEVLLYTGSNKTFVIDEIDRRLHPLLTCEYIKRFLEIAKEKNIQLLVTTHESRLMDLDILRRDEIWFVDKNTYGESELFSLEDFNVRFDQKIDKAYLDGKFGGIPTFQ